jgi:hypothetical protein
MVTAGMKGKTMAKFTISYGSQRVGQFELPGTEPDIAGMLQRKADARLQPGAAQKALDVGLWSEDARGVVQTDLNERKDV